MDQCKPFIEQQQPIYKSSDNENNNLVDNLDDINLGDRTDYETNNNNNIIDNNENVNTRQCNSVSLVNRDYDISKLKYLVGLNLFNR